MRVPSPARSRLARLYETIRYEDGQWPLWRWDRNLRYVAKSLLHRDTPWTEADRAAWQVSQDYLAGGTWRRTPARSSVWSVGGDAMWIRSGWERALSDGITEQLRRSDLAVFNLETPIDPQSPVLTYVYETFRYNAPLSYLTPWKAAPRVVASLCNNHALDQGADGLMRTRQSVLSSGMVPVGGLSPGDAVASVEVSGLRCGFVGLTYDVNRPPCPIPAGIPVIRLGAAVDWRQVEALLAAARAVGPDLVAVLAHWSSEYEVWPTARQREDAYRLVALGADLVLGSSPHVLQPVEIVSIGGADPDCPTQIQREGPPGFGLVVWSLGNLLTIMPTLRCQVGALLQLELGREEGLVFSSLRAVPTLCRRGLGDRWIDARALTLDEYARHHDVSRPRALATQTLWPLLPELP